ncbi:MAG: hypothetical protein K0Q97_3061, partial [Bacillota bacterium]|nr:hypothetical protein [Bacillota bacterium]
MLKTENIIICCKSVVFMIILFDIQIFIKI